MKKLLPLLLTVFLLSTSVTHASIIPLPRADSVYICVSGTAHKYHKYVCKGLMKCTHQIKMVTKAQAIKLGYTACKICY